METANICHLPLFWHFLPVYGMFIFKFFLRHIWLFAMHDECDMCIACILWFKFWKFCYADGYESNIPKTMILLNDSICGNQRNTITSWPHRSLNEYTWLKFIQFVQRAGRCATCISNSEMHMTIVIISVITLLHINGKIMPPSQSLWWMQPFLFPWNGDPIPNKWKKNE